MNKRHVISKVKAKAFDKEVTAAETFYFNDSCSLKEVALGVTTLNTVNKTL